MITFIKRFFNLYWKEIKHQLMLQKKDSWRWFWLLGMITAFTITYPLGVAIVVLSEIAFFNVDCCFALYRDFANVRKSSLKKYPQYHSEDRF